MLFRLFLIALIMILVLRPLRCFFLARAAVTIPAVLGGLAGLYVGSLFHASIPQNYPWLVPAYVVMGAMLAIEAVNNWLRNLKQ